MEGLPQNQESYENYEGRVEIDGRKIILDGEKVGAIALRNNGDYYSVGFITIDEKLRGKGLGEAVYKKLVETLDKPLRSDLHISDAGEGLWEKFVRKGLAKQIGTIPSGKGWYEWIK